METVQRYGRPARWFHAAVYTIVLVLLGTGWWFVIDRYQHPLLGQDAVTDTLIHETAGLLMIGVTAGYTVVRARAAWRFVRQSTVREPGDLRWLAALPRAALTGRFPHHDGHYDPGQRLANVVMIATLAALATSGLGMLYLPSPSASLLAADVHRWAAFVLTPVLLGHIVVASGVLPGYRGVWRSMHLGGRLPRAVAHRIWPGWLDRHDRAAGPISSGSRR
jgi:formate dehydrogenase subunit gamma